MSGLSTPHVVMLGSGGLLLYAAINNINPLDVAKTVVQGGDLKSLAEEKEWTAKPSQDVFPNPPGTALPPTGGGTGLLEQPVKPGSVAAKAITWGEKQVQDDTTGWFYRCLAFVQLCYVNGAGLSQTPQGNATNGARNAQYMHRGRIAIPAGVPVWWGGGDGHVALSRGGGWCITTDYPKKDYVGFARISEVNNWLGSSHPYIGWSEDSCGTRVYGKGR